MNTPTNTPTTGLDGFEQMLRERMHRLADHAPATVPAPGEVRVNAAAEPRRGRRAAGIGAAIALVAGGAGLTGIALQSAAEPGGADSPEAAVREFAGALADEDLLGMIDVTLPEEVTALRAAFEDITFQAKRIGLLDEAFALDGVAGVDVTVDGLGLTTTPIDSDLVAVTSTNGTIGAIFDATAFPLGRLIGGDSAMQIDDGSTTFDLATGPITLVTMQRGDGWYVSMGMSIAEAIRQANGSAPPESVGIIAEGSTSPEAAAEAFFDRLAQLDLTSASALVAPGEGDVFRRYASLWLPPAQQALSDAGSSGLSIEVSGLQFERIADSGGRVTLRPTAFVIDGTTPAGWNTQNSTGVVMTPEWPTVIGTPDGAGVWILDPGVVPPATIDGLGEPVPYESDAAQALFTNGEFNSTYAIPDGTIIAFVDETAAPADPQPFRIVRSDDCTTMSGTPFSDIAASAPGSERIDDNTVRTCADDGAFGVGSALLLFAGSGSLSNLPPLTLVNDDGQWFVSPIGTIAAQVLESMRSLPEDVNIIDVPLLPLYAGAIARAQLDQYFLYTADVSAPCRAIGEDDGSGHLRTVADPAFADVLACTRAMGYSDGGFGTVETSSSGVDAAVAIEEVPASTMPATVDSVQYPPPTTPVTTSP